MHRSTPTLKFLLIPVLLHLAACSQQPTEQPRATAEAASSSMLPASPEAAKEDASSGPSEATSTEIGITVAPGVAFTYSYSFTLPGEAIAKVQQQHAAACERLGLARCQVTGMSYYKRDARIHARLDLLVAPDVANRLGSESVALVEDVDGILSDANVNGENAGMQIDASQRQSKAMQEEFVRLQKRLAAGGLAHPERSAISERIEELHRQLASEQLGREEKELAIATTPMQFHYSASGLFAASKDPFGRAASTSFDSAATLLSFLMTVLGLVLPWLMLVGVIMLVARHVALRRRLFRPATPAIVPPTETADPA